ncbi:MAG: hypothetical protein ACXW00_07730 [Methylobacter sp.]
MKTSSNNTKDTLREFMRNAIPLLIEILRASPLAWDFDAQWERKADGHFRAYNKRLWHWSSIPNRNWLFSLPNYQTCVDHLKSDPIIGPHLDSCIGTELFSLPFDPEEILTSLIYTMLDDEGHLVFTDERFDEKWDEWLNLFENDQIPCNMVAPIPYLTLPEYPLRLNCDLVLDRLTDDEVTRCYQAGVIRPDSPRMPFIPGEIGIRIRKKTFLPKLILSGNTVHKTQEPEKEGNFGNRPFLQSDLVIEDVLSALRLFKHGNISSKGHVKWVDAIKLNTGTSFQVLGHYPNFGAYQLSENEVPQFLELWHLLGEWAACFSFSIHRFNLSFERRLLADRIVDLVIAAESLFLRDSGDEKYRGEIRFRFSLRAAKFIEHPSYNEREIFRKMRDAYDERSAIVHGGKPTKKLTLTFIEEIEDFVRIGIRKALSMGSAGNKLEKSEYWNDLMFSERNNL